MKKTLGILAVLGAITLGGCTTSSVPFTSANEEMMAKVESMVDSDEVYGIGSAKINQSGETLAKEKALEKAKENLEKKLSKNSRDVYDAYLTEFDEYSSVLNNSALTDMSEYAARDALTEATEKGSWTVNETIYVVVAVDQSAVEESSKETFVEQLETFSKKIDDMKEEVYDIPVTDANEDTIKNSRSGVGTDLVLPEDDNNDIKDVNNANLIDVKL